MIVQGSRHAGRTHNYSVVRLAALEARAMKRANLMTILYLPIIFFGYGFLLGNTIILERKKRDFFAKKYKPMKVLLY